MSARTLLIAVSAISLLGCGRNSDGSQGFATGVNSNSLLADLTTQQATQLCDDVTRANTATLAPTLCESSNQFGALNVSSIYLEQHPMASDADLRTECTYILNLPDYCGPAVTCDAGYLVENTTDNCTATVADIADCVNGNDALYRGLLAASPPCDTVTASSVTAYFAPGGPYDTYSNATATRSASCTALLDCYGIYPINNTSPGS